MEYVVYCDESRHEGPGHHTYMSIGGLWVPRSEKIELTRQFRALCRSLNLCSEIKWNKVSATRLEAYKRLVDFFFEHESLFFRVIVVNRTKVNVEKYHGGDWELGFYKFYYEMLEKSSRGQTEYARPQTISTTRIKGVVYTQICHKERSVLEH